MQFETLLEIFVCATNGEFVAGHVSWLKKWKAHDMIPMGVAHQDVCFAFTSTISFLHENPAQFFHARTTVDDDMLITGAYFDTGRVSTNGVFFKNRMGFEKGAGSIWGSKVVPLAFDK